MDVCVLYIKRNKIRLKNKKKFTKETTLCAYVCYIKPVVKQEWVCGYILFFLFIFCCWFYGSFWRICYLSSILGTKREREREKNKQTHLLEQLKVFLLSVPIFSLIKIDWLLVVERRQNQFHIQLADIYLPVLFQLDLNKYISFLFLPQWFVWCCCKWSASCFEMIVKFY